MSHKQGAEVTDDGGAIIQATNITTGLTINGTTGKITTQAATTAAEASDTFTVTNNRVGPSSIILANIESAVAQGIPIIQISNIVSGTQSASGSFDITLTNPGASGGDALAQAFVIRFVIINPIKRKYKKL